MYCTCRDCKRMKRKGKILGSFLLKHLGPRAHFVSAYVNYPKFMKGRKPETKAFSDV